MDAAVQAMKDAGFPDGSEGFPGRCRWGHRGKKEEVLTTAPSPAHWFHAYLPAWTPDNSLSEDNYNDMLRDCTHSDICLHRKSEALWALPDPSLEDPAPDDPNYMLATDLRLPDREIPGFGRGCYTVPGCRVQIPTPSRFTESLFLNWVREFKMVDKGFFWKRYLIYMEQYVYKKSIDEDFLSPATLDPPFGEIWKALLKQHPPVENFSRKYLVPLREDLIRKGALPDTAVPWVMTNLEMIALTYKRAAENKAILKRAAVETDATGTDAAETDATETDAAETDVAGTDDSDTVFVKSFLTAAFRL